MRFLMMPCHLRSQACFLTLCLAMYFACPWEVGQTEDLLRLQHEACQVGVDLQKGGSITWLSWKEYPQNAVNISDPGRLIQQSYYAGASLDRRSEGQSRAWSPWPWNPIQGGGVGSWARVVSSRKEGSEIYTETIPKLWDMPNEEATASMKQWTQWEPEMQGVIQVRCEFRSERLRGDRWGDGQPMAQEIPACYFTRNFSRIQSYLGDGAWREETQPPGPPWGHATPPHRAMACFEKSGQGIAIYSPCSNMPWNFGPHGQGASQNPQDGPCIHIAPLERVAFKPKTIYQYRYWLIVGDEKHLTHSIDRLKAQYASEVSQVEVIDTPE
ncbi:MAG: hypothetical protein U0905_11995 [Pirellulales bacterium]